MSEAIKVFKPILSNSDFSELFNSSHITPEKLLLKWPSVRVLQVNQKEKIITQYIQLQNTNFIKFLLQSHYPSVFNLSVIDALREMKFPLIPAESFFSHKNPCVYALFLSRLFQYLSTFKLTTIANFRAHLNGESSQSVTISNPSEYELLYTSKIDGSSEFSIEKGELLIWEKSSIEVLIISKASNHLQQTATLTFSPSTPRSSVDAFISTTSNLQTAQEDDLPPMASSIVFTLIADVFITKPSKIFFIETPIYAAKSLEITVMNVVVEVESLRYSRRQFLLMIITSLL